MPTTDHSQQLHLDPYPPGVDKVTLALTLSVFDHEGNVIERTVPFDQSRDAPEAFQMNVLLVRAGIQDIQDQVMSAVAAFPRVGRGTVFLAPLVDEANRQLDAGTLTYALLARRLDWYRHDRQRDEPDGTRVKRLLNRVMCDGDTAKALADALGVNAIEMGF